MNDVTRKFFAELMDETRKRQTSGQVRDEKSQLNEAFYFVSSRYDSHLTRNAKVLIDYLIEKKGTTLDDLIKHVKVRLDSKYLTEVVETEKRDRFDALNSTNTGSPIQQYEMPEDVSLDRLLESAAYVPSPSSVLALLFPALRLVIGELSQYIFIDVGAGLGKVMLLASQFPFKRVLGLELSPYLSKRCTKNLTDYKGPLQCNDVEILCMNALDFRFPQSDLVLYFWEPFSNDVSNKFINGLVDFMKTNSYNIVLAFLGTVFDRVERSTEFELVRTIAVNDPLSLYESNPVSIFTRKYGLDSSAQPQ